MFYNLKSQYSQHLAHGFYTICTWLRSLLFSQWNIHTLILGHRSSWPTSNFTTHQHLHVAHVQLLLPSSNSYHIHGRQSHHCRYSCKGVVCKQGLFSNWGFLLTSYNIFSSKNTVELLFFPGASNILDTSLRTFHIFLPHCQSSFC